MTMAKRSAARAGRWTLGATIGIALAAPVCGATDAATREPIERESSIFDDAAGAASTTMASNCGAASPVQAGLTRRGVLRPRWTATSILRV